MMQMKYFSRLVILPALLFAGGISYANEVACFPMDVSGKQITETVSGNTFYTSGVRVPENVPGAKGNALRLDGYSSYVSAYLNNVLPENASAMTVSLWCALETYPIMKIDEATSERACIAGCLDDASKTGFAFLVGADGKYSFECYTGGWKVTCEAAKPLPCYEWNNLVAVVDGSALSATLYNNGEVVATSRCMSPVNMKAGKFMIGRGTTEVFSGPFLLNSINGLIDDICIYDEALPESEIKGWKAECPADLAIPESRFANDLMRPRFHGMPGANWTNETHGLVKYNGKYHAFFQKNANGPYMARLQWGHIVSDNLYDWKEMPIALNTDHDYDVKGCWSGCVFADNSLTGGKPNIFYTAVDYGRATIAQAIPMDDNLLDWMKPDYNPVINGRPEGLSDDFRDPYLFKNGNNYYMLVGTSKNGYGAATLHRYSNGNWSNDGSMFFTGSNVRLHGTFWEMSNVTKIGDHWLFTTTPLGKTVDGTEVIYWTGDINADGTFSPLPAFATRPQKVELDGFSKEGYGLLSPSIMQCDGKTIAIGIVPDKLPSEENYKLGWAHTYSLPREWSLDAEGMLVQKPFEGLKEMRTEEKFSRAYFDLDGTLSLNPVSGRQLEVCGSFVIGSVPFGFNLFKTGDKAVKVYYTPSNNVLTVDFAGIDRIVNDNGIYNGLYQSSLPKQLASGETLKLNVFVDHSIMDIFVNDTWAFSVRLFPTDADANGVEAFSNGATKVNSLEAWMLNAGNGQGSVENVPVEHRKEASKVYAFNGNVFYRGMQTGALLAVYDLAGNLVFHERVPENNGSIALARKGAYVVCVTSLDEKQVYKVIL